MSKKSPTAKKALEEYLAKNNISIPEKTQTKKDLSGYKKSEKSSGLTVEDYGFNGSSKDHGIYIYSINKAKKLHYMNDKEIFSEILNDYSEALSEVVKMSDSKNIFLYLLRKHMQDGVCLYSRMVKGVSLIRNNYVQMYQRDENAYWTRQNVSVENNPDLNKRILGQRVDILQKIVNQIKEDERTV